jgi:hypothetical protein
LEANVEKRNTFMDITGLRKKQLNGLWLKKRNSKKRARKSLEKKEIEEKSYYTLKEPTISDKSLEK